MCEENIGYTMGGVQAVDLLLRRNASLRRLALSYEWVVHLHPDIFIVDPKPLVKALESAGEAAHVIAARRLTASASHGHRRVHVGLTFNFFAFRPQLIEEDAFRWWSNWSASPESYLHDVAFANQMRRKCVRFVEHISQKRSSCGVDPRCFVDRFGLWHMHNETLVASRLHLFWPWLDVANAAAAVGSAKHVFTPASNPAAPADGTSAGSTARSTPLSPWRGKVNRTSAPRIVLGNLLAEVSFLRPPEVHPRSFGHKSVSKLDATGGLEVYRRRHDTPVGVAHAHAWRGQEESRGAIGR
jgi:hypothetical protein